MLAKNFAQNLWKKIILKIASWNFFKLLVINGEKYCKFKFEWKITLYKILPTPNLKKIVILAKIQLQNLKKIIWKKLQVGNFQIISNKRWKKKKNPNLDLLKKSQVQLCGLSHSFASWRFILLINPRCKDRKQQSGVTKFASCHFNLLINPRWWLG